MSLYGKYRPQTFSEVIGQDHIVTTLERAQAQDRLAHAYLFSGPRGTGKTSAARILAKGMLIRGIDDPKIVAQIKKGVLDGSLVDLIEIDAASNRGIDDIRNLVEKIQFSPVAASAKVYIIDEVHMLTKEAFNALLKTLEEPPEYAYFILATTELQKIPLTIQSRCQRFAFRQIQEEDITRHLQKIADDERITIDRPALRTIAHHVQGGMRDAIALLDQLRSLEKITLEDVKQRTGESGQEYVEAMFAAIEQKNTEGILEITHKMEDEAIPLDMFLRLMLRTIREKMHDAIKEKNDIQELVQLLDVLLEAIRDIRISPVPGLVLESTLLSLCSENIPKETNVTKEPQKEPIPALSSEKPIDKSKKVASLSEPEQPPETPDFSLETIQKCWPDVLKQTSPPSVRMSLKNGRVTECAKEKVTVSFPSTFHRDKVAKAEAARTIEKILEGIFQKELRLECILEKEKTSVEEEEVVDLAEAAREVF